MIIIKAEYCNNLPFAELKSQDGCCIFKLSIHGYQFPEIETGYDADWLKTYTYLSIPGFRAEIDEPMFEGRTLKSLTEDLEKFSTLDKEDVHFSPNEEFFRLSLTLNNQKKVGVTGTVEYPLGWGARLEFEFETDLTYIDNFIKGLKDITQHFPSRL